MRPSFCPCREDRKTAPTRSVHTGISGAGPSRRAPQSAARPACRCPQAFSSARRAAADPPMCRRSPRSGYSGTARRQAPDSTAGRSSAHPTGHPAGGQQGDRGSGRSARQSASFLRRAPRTGTRTHPEAFPGKAIPTARRFPVRSTAESQQARRMPAQTARRALSRPS